jgi:hypothetical protein
MVIQLKDSRKLNVKEGRHLWRSRHLWGQVRLVKHFLILV